jgi:hypothetical protein
MIPQALTEFVPFLIKCGEGKMMWLYLDSKGLVTVGIGNMLPNLAAALALSWVDLNGNPVGAAAITAAWNAITARKDLIGKGGGFFRNVTSIRLTEASLDALIDRDISEDESVLIPLFPGYATVPWQAQVALLRLSWAMGAYFASNGKWPNLRAAWAAQNWAACAQQCRIPELDATEPQANEDEAQLFEECLQVAA